MSSSSSCCWWRQKGFRILVVFISIFSCHVRGQRVKTGCYDSHPEAFATCNDPDAIPTAQEYHQLSQTMNIEDVCYHIITNVFHTDNKVIWDASSHPDYLNGIDANTEICSEIQQAYRHCLFCASYWTIRFDCQHEAEFVRCGGRPSREEILMMMNGEEDNEDGNPFKYFQTDADIDRTCNQLERAYQQLDPWITDLDVPVPTTLDLCERQHLVKHLCPGYCEGDCFSEEDYLPTCDLEAYQGPIDATLDAFKVCDEVSFEAFHKADIGEIMSNVTNHLDYLKFLHKEDPLCNQAKQVYSQCYWCSDSRCFGDHHPTSCEPYVETIDPDIDVQDTCREMLYAFDNVSFEDELNIAAHKFLIPEEVPFCEEARQVYHLCFWCAPSDVPFEFCLPNTPCNSTVPLPDDFVSTTLTALGFETPSRSMKTDDALPHPFDCSEIYHQWELDWSDPFSLQACYEDIYLGRLCPVEFCEAPPPSTLGRKYLGATTTRQKRALIWVSRVSSILSFAGASYILWDSLKDSSTRSLTYNQLLMGMAIFDIVTAFAWVFATAPIDKDEASHVEGAMGNDKTCTAQAFFIQLGFTSVFYNVSLALYYALVIAYDWREFHLRNIRKYLLTLPVVLGLGLAIGVLFQYHWLEYGCHILPPPEGDMWAALVFVVLPLGSSIIAITASMLVVYWHVRQRAENSKRWSFGVGLAGRVEQAVFWQCLFYVCAFYITWPVLFSVYLASIDVDGPLGLTLVVAFVAPLQGFSNFLVYIRPKIYKREPDGISTAPRRRGSSSKFSSSLMGMMKGMVAPRSSVQMSSTEQHPGTGVPHQLAEMDPSVALALQEDSNQDTCGSKELTSFGTEETTNGPRETIVIPSKDSDDELCRSGKGGSSHRRGSGSSRHLRNSTKEGTENEKATKRTSLGPFELPVGELLELENLSVSEDEVNRTELKEKHEFI